jgi:hypothetical protein
MNVSKTSLLAAYVLQQAGSMLTRENVLNVART